MSSASKKAVNNVHNPFNVDDIVVTNLDRKISPSASVNSWLEYMKCSYQIDSTEVTTKFRPDWGGLVRFRADQIVDRIYLDAAEAGLRDQLNRDLIRISTSSWINETINNKRKEVYERIRYNASDKDADALISQLLDLWCGPSSSRRRVLDSKVMKHALRNVKKKLRSASGGSGPSSFYQLMVILYGPQGRGKNEALKRLFNVLAPFCDLENSVQNIDKNEYGRFERNFVFIFDELSQLEKADIQVVKSLVTSDKLTQRRFYTQDHVQLTHNASFFAGSNRCIFEVFQDPTGMRRFWQIDCWEKVNSEENWAAINKFDYEALWRSIDENIEGDFFQYLQEISREQEQQRVKSPIELWFEGTDAEKKIPSQAELLTRDKPNSECEFVNTTDCYNQWRNFCDRENITPWRKQTFEKGLAEYLRKRGAAECAGRVGGRRGYWLMEVKSSSTKSLFKGLDVLNGGR